MGCQTIAGKVGTANFYEQFYGTRSNDGGIRNGNLQEQQWHLVCNDPAIRTGQVQESKNVKEDLLQERGSGLGITV